MIMGLVGREKTIQWMWSRGSHIELEMSQWKSNAEINRSADENQQKMDTSTKNCTRDGCAKEGTELLMYKSNRCEKIKCSRNYYEERRAPAIN